MHRETTCVLCGITSHDVSTALIAWKQPVGTEWFTAAPRCKDHPACRGRVEAAGADWDVRDPARSTLEMVR